MAIVDRYANFDLTTGANDGTSEADAWQSWDDVYAGLTAGIRVNIKKQSSPQQITSSILFNNIDSITSPPTSTLPIIFNGYGSTTGDNVMWEAEIDTGGVAQFNFSCTECSFENLKVHSKPTSNLGAVYLTPLNGYIRNCSLIGSSVLVSGAITKCYFGVRTTGSEGNVNIRGGNQAAVHITDCAFESMNPSSSNATLVTVDMYGRRVTFTNCVFLSRHTDTLSGIFLDRLADGESVQIQQCRFYGLGKAIEVDEEPDAGSETVIVRNCVFEDCTYGVYRNNAELGFVLINNNYYRNMTSGFTNYSEIAAWNNTALTADAFVDGPNGNLLLNSTSGGGQVVRDAGGSYDNGGTFETASEFFGTMFEEGGGAAGPVTYSYFG